MSNDFFEAILNPTWKTLELELKLVVFQNILRFFVNPLRTVENVKPVTFSYGGIKTETFEVQIDGKKFVFVPGQKRAVLGWGNGLAGLDGLDCSEERQELRLAIKQYIAANVSAHMFEQNEVEWEDLTKEILSVQFVDESINALTSPLREVDIPAMLVEQVPQFVGLRYLGAYCVVSGDLQTNGEPVSEEIMITIQQLVVPDLTQTIFLQEYPTVVRSNSLFIIQNKEDSDVFDCYMDDAVSYQDVKTEIERQGMCLLTADEWEYCCGATTRRLFRWGNKMHRSLLCGTEESLLQMPNMFGLTIGAIQWGPELVEDEQRFKGGWIEEKHKAPILNLLPFSSYYYSPQRIEDPHALLDAGFYAVRRVIKIEM